MAQRLDAQRADYDDGRITLDRYLDAVSQYATAVATEAEYKTTYNISLAALAEAKGTLLTDRNIEIARGAASAEGVCPGSQVAQPVPPTAANVLSGEWLKVARPLKWKGTRDLMTVAAAFAADMPDALEVPRVGAFSMPPMSVNDLAYLGIRCDAKPEATTAIANAQTSSTSTKVELRVHADQSDAPAKVKPKTWTFSKISSGERTPCRSRDHHGGRSRVADCWRALKTGGGWRVESGE